MDTFQELRGNMIIMIMATVDFSILIYAFINLLNDWHRKIKVNKNNQS